MDKKLKELIKPKCKTCGKRKNWVSRRGNCKFCAAKISIKVAEQMHKKKGPYWDKYVKSHQEYFNKFKAS